MNLHQILSRPEGKTVEFKRDLSSHRPVLRTLAAFANGAGGVLVFGVDDSRSLRGVPDDALAFEERVANLVSDGISPRLVPDIELFTVRGVTLVAVTVYPGASRPYHVAAEGPAEGVYVRVGSTNRRADAFLIAELARSVLGESFDETPLPELRSDAVDLDAARRAFAGVRELRQADLVSLRLLTKSGKRQVPTVGGVLLFGADREANFPDAWLQAGRFKGSRKAHIIDSARIDGPLPELVDEAMAFVKRHIALRMVIEGARRAESWEYPLAAVREAVVNAIVHADYSATGSPVRIAIFDDRMEIENPGLLVPGMTLDDVYGGVSRLRNRVIGRVFRELGLIEQWGSGVQRMVEACRDAGLPDPEIEELGSAIRVTLRASQQSKPRTDELDEQVLTELAENQQGLSTADIAERIDRTTRATRTRLKALVEEGLVVEVGTGPKDPLRRYLLAEERARYRSR